MAYLKYKTRGDSHPMGKQKIYFACHPDDFYRYIGEITDDIFETQNCAVYYSDLEQDYTVEELVAYLSEMQLFVVPITKKLLTEKARVMDIEIPYALKRHIPILPLLQEALLVEPFRAVFGDLQYLNKHIRDNTAISYAEKLKKYLDEILVSDDTTKKVRAAFNAYIFLSYRKKDRKYAQDLMHMIHKNDFCRDIAIWYDEFLSPGENFNNVISDTLNKSELFTLVVTPNLINEENYIMKVEYPHARRAGKTILPVEMVETDCEALEESYEGIPICVDANEAALRDALMRSLSRIALEENNNDPQHNFFIGLAYLSGIDVEVDYDRAVELITGAAEKGCVAAVRKLISMYGNGEGVALSRDKEIEWTRQLIDLYKDGFKKEPNMTNLLKVHGALSDLVLLLFNQNDLSQAIEVAESELEDYSREVKYALQHSEQDNFDLDLKEGLRDSDPLPLSIVKARSDVRIAKAMLEQIIHVWKSEAQTIIGNLLLAKGMFEQAKAYFIRSNECLIKMKYGSAENDYQYVNVLKELANEDLSRSYGVMHDIAQNYGFLGDLEFKRGRTSDALVYFEKQLEVITECAKLYPLDEEGAFQLCSALTNTAWVQYSQHGDIREVEGKLIGAVNILKSLYAQNRSDRVFAALATNFQHLARVYLQCNDSAQAYEYINQAIKINHYLAYEKGLRVYERNLNNDKAILYQVLDHRNINLEQESDISKLVARWDKCEDASQRSLIDQRLQNIYRERRQRIAVEIQVDHIEKAKEIFVECLAIRKFFAQCIATTKECRSLGEEYAELAKFLIDNEHRNAALENYQSALDVYMQVYKNSQLQTDLKAIKRISTTIGKAYLKKGELKKAYQYIKMATQYN